jgi:hypothetical protein
MPESLCLKTCRCGCLDQQLVLLWSAIRIEGFDFAVQRVVLPAIRSSGITGQQRNLVNLCG